MQVRLRTNMSDPFPEKIVRERLPMGSAVYLERLLPFVYLGGSIRCLFFVGAVVRVELRGILYNRTIKRGSFDMYPVFWTEVKN